METPLFEQVADAFRGVCPSDLGPWHHRVHRGGIKVWFGAASGSRVHYEAQLIARRHVDGADGVAFEVGFHAEHPKVADNDAVVDRLVGCEQEWRAALGDEAVAGPFLGRPGDWRRISEVWLDPDLSDGDAPLEIAARLADYVEALEPVLRAGP